MVLATVQFQGNFKCSQTHGNRQGKVTNAIRFQNQAYHQFEKSSIVSACNQVYPQFQLNHSISSKLREHQALIKYGISSNQIIVHMHISPCDKCGISDQVRHQ